MEILNTYLKSALPREAMQLHVAQDADEENWEKVESQTFINLSGLDKEDRYMEALLGQALFRQDKWAKPLRHWHVLPN